MTAPAAGRRTVLVTGGTRGIGRAIVAALAPGWRVLVGGTDADAVARVVAEVAAECPDATGFVADLADADATAAAAAGIDRLDAVVHSAGVLACGPVAEASREEWRRVLEVNVVAVAHLTGELLGALRAARGHVVVINSGSGFNAGAGSGVYAASKFAVRAFADALRADERGRIRVTSVHPGRVATDMQVALREAEGETYRAEDYLTPQAVADAVAGVLASEASASVDTLSIRPSGLASD